MKKSPGLLIVLILAILTMMAGLAGLAHLNAAFRKQETLSFTDPAGDTLVGTYIPGEAPVGVIFLEGFGSDQIAMRPAASVFLEAGAHIFTFDFSGHGRSPGTLGFDNAATDRLARQVMAAKACFKDLSGLTEAQIIYFGHSLGARVALQSALLDPAPPSALVLLGTQINLIPNVQAEFFTGTSDADLAWVQSLGPENPPSHILMIGSTWDDILTPEAMLALFSQLNGGPPTSKLDLGATRHYWMTRSIIHNYEIYSPKILKTSILWLPNHLRASLIADDSTIVDQTIQSRMNQYALFGGLTLAGLLVTLALAPLFLRKALPIPAARPVASRVLRLGPFLWGKLLLWLAALPASALLTGLFFLVPLGLPVFNMLYVGFIGGYGLLMLILYLLGRVPGTTGKWPLKRNAEALPFTLRDPLLWGGLLFWGVVLLALVLLTRSGLYYVIAPNQRLAWLAIFTPATALGFWIGARENAMLEVFSHEAGRRTAWARVLLSLIGLTPFFLFTLFMGLLGSLSGMVGGLQGLLILLIVLMTGDVLSHFVRQRWLIAFLQAILLYALILPQGVLFAF
jgi:pimeloyl-ACP methyl ester carboxylesterase